MNTDSNAKTQRRGANSIQADGGEERIEPRSEEVRRTQALGQHFHRRKKQHHTQREVVGAKHRRVEREVAAGFAGQPGDDAFLHDRREHDARASGRGDEEKLEQPVGDELVALERGAGQCEQDRGHDEETGEGKSSKAARHERSPAGFRQQREAPLHHPAQGKDQRNGQDQSEAGARAGKGGNQGTGNGAHDVGEQHEENGLPPNQSAFEERKRAAFERHRHREPDQGLSQDCGASQGGTAQQLSEREDRFASQSRGWNRKQRQNCKPRMALLHKRECAAKGFG